MLDPERCKACQAALATLPIPCWDVHVNDHSQMLQESILKLAKQFFTTQRREKQRPKLSEATLALIQLKRSALDYGRKMDLMSDVV